MERYRRNLVTYPFHYNKINPEEFFQHKEGSVYIHIPFCNQRCKFCNFKAYKILDEATIDGYLEALKSHIRLYCKKRIYPDYKIDAINFGGGNPGLLSADKILNIVATVKENFDVLPGAEISIEFDPINVEEEKLLKLKAAGFNRVSMGVQSLDDAVLKKVGRIHSKKDAVESFDLIKKSGFKNINLDLVYPFPEQTLIEWEETIDQVLELEPPALSTYGLELWPGTPYYNDKKRGEFNVCSGEEEALFYSSANNKILEKGYDQITVYGYVKKEFKAKYHCKFMEKFYWNNLPMIGFGVAAMNYLEGDFFVNERTSQKYIQLISDGVLPVSFGKHLNQDEQMRRYIIRGLKKREVSCSDFFSRYGQKLEKYFEKELNSAISKGLLLISGDLVKLTPLGCNYNTNVYREFFKEGDLKDEGLPGIVYFGISMDLDGDVNNGSE